MAATTEAFDDILTDLDLTAPAPAPAPAASAPAAPAVMRHQPTALEVFYQSVEKAQAEELQAAAARIKERERVARACIIETGNDLIAIKDAIPGQFDKWLKIEFNMSKGTAWNYISAAQRFSATPKVVEILPPATVYKLAAPATPEELRQSIVLEIEAGEIPSKHDVETRIAEARQKAAEAEAAEREEAEAERVRQADEAAWQERARELADAGKTEAEIEKERTKWQSPTAAKQRERDKKRRERDRRAQKLEEENLKRLNDLEREKQEADELVTWLLAELGREKFEFFRSKLSSASLWTIRLAIAKFNPAAIETEDEPEPRRDIAA